MKLLTVGERIRKRRKELKLTADQVADQLDLNRSTIFRYEKNEIDMTLSVLEPLSRVLKTTPTYLMGWLDGPGRLMTEEERIIDVMTDVLNGDKQYLKKLILDIVELDEEEVDAVRTTVQIFKKKKEQ